MYSRNQTIKMIVYLCLFLIIVYNLYYFYNFSNSQYICEIYKCGIKDSAVVILVNNKGEPIGNHLVIILTDSGGTRGRTNNNGIALIGPICGTVLAVTVDDSQIEFWPLEIAKIARINTDHGILIIIKSK